MNTADFIYQGTKKSIEKASFTCQTPSNIALVKYWGKSDPQIPKNASISFTLNHCHTKTTITFTKVDKNTTITFDLYFEGKKKEDFKPKISKHSVQNKLKIQCSSYILGLKKDEGHRVF